ncbi:hypothetical protein CK622_08085 [Campylobacter upsaliensis]|nr:hypothetical protein [Campylobacter upsaliensis]TNB59745.1 hypothetical protein FDR72_07735 [Campylobacter helveticus]
MQSLKKIIMSIFKENTISMMMKIFPQKTSSSLKMILAI